MKVVVIGHNEGKSVSNIINSFAKYWNVVYVADRCTDNTLEELLDGRKNGGLLVVLEVDLDFGGRLTSHCRNLGGRFLGMEDEEGVCFFDGDRYPIDGSIEEAIKACSSDILLFRVEDDFRTKEDFKINYGRVYNGFFSCGMWMSKKAYDRISEFQGGEIFRTDMQWWWGIEDTYLGDVCYHLGLSAELCDTVTLNGTFERNTLDSLDVIEKRLRERSKLDVKW